MTTNELSAFHSVFAYNAQTSKPKEGERLAVIFYKGRKEKVKQADGSISDVSIPKWPSLCVSVPQLQLSLGTMPAAIAAVTRSLWEGIQDELIKSLIDEKRSKENPAKTTKHSLADSEIDIAACASFAAASGNGKLSGEQITSWFDTSLASALTEALLVKNAGITDDQLASALANFRASMAKLAAPNPGLPENDYNQLRKALAASPDDDAMATKLITKIDSLTKKQVDTLVSINL